MPYKILLIAFISIISFKGYSQTSVNNDSLFTDIQTAIKTPQRVKILKLDATSLPILTENIHLFTNLKELDLSGANIETIPRELSKLPSLEALNLNHNIHLKHDSTFLLLSEIPTLKTLHLVNTGISTFPTSFSALTQLEHINLSGNDFKALPTSIQNLQNLHTISLNETPYLDWKMASELMSNLKNLKTLHLNDNNFETFPEHICQLEALEYLHLSNNKLTELPTTMCLPKNLVELHLTNNPITKNKNLQGNDNPANAKIKIIGF